MSIVFEQIVSRRLSQQYENVATDALAFIVDQYPAARAALIRLLKSAQPTLSDSLVFSTQDGQGDARPDLAGTNTEGHRELFIEVKFWAGLTAGQPVRYLELLRDKQQGLVAFIVPKDRTSTVWSELARRVRTASTLEEHSAPPAQIYKLADTGLGPRLALTSWRSVHHVLESELPADAQARSDIQQLRGLCDRADAEAFLPFAPEDLTDQRLPVRLLQFSEIAEAAVHGGIEDGYLCVERLRATHGWDRTGRYLQFGNNQGVGGWFGVDLTMWRQHGRTPLWLRFSPGPWGRAEAVGPLLKQWSLRKNPSPLVKLVGGEAVISVDLATGLEHDAVVEHVLEQLHELRAILADVQPSGHVPVPEEAKE